MRLLITHEIHAIEADGKFYNPKGLIDYNAMCNYPRKHLIVFPILVMWVLSHLAYKYGTHIKQSSALTQSDLFQQLEDKEEFLVN